MIISRSIHVAANGIISFFFLYSFFEHLCAKTYTWIVGIQVWVFSSEFSKLSTKNKYYFKRKNI